MGLVWLGYGLGLYGYSLIKGYDLSAGQVFSPVSYYRGKWPPPLVSDPTVIIPAGRPASSSASKGKGKGKGKKKNPSGGAGGQA